MVPYLALFFLELLGFATFTVAQPLSQALLIQCEMGFATHRYQESSPYYNYLQGAMEKMTLESVDAWQRWKANYQTRGADLFFRYTSIFPISNPLDPNICRDVIHYRAGCRYSSSCLNSTQCKECIYTLSKDLIDNLCYLSMQGSAYAGDCFVRYANIYLGEDSPRWPFFRY